MPGGPRISIPYSAAIAVSSSGVGTWADAGGSVSASAGTDPRADEVCERGRVGDHQEAGHGRRDDEGVRDVARPVHERSGRSDDRLAADPEGHLTVDHVEPLVLVVMDMERRAAAVGPEKLDHGQLAAGRLGRGLDRAQGTDEPACVAFAGLEGDRGDGLGRGRTHL